MLKVSVTSDLRLEKKTDPLEFFQSELDAFEENLMTEGQNPTNPVPVQPLTRYERWLIARYLKFRLQSSQTS